MTHDSDDDATITDTVVRALRTAGRHDLAERVRTHPSLNPHAVATIMTDMIGGVLDWTPTNMDAVDALCALWRMVGRLARFAHVETQHERELRALGYASVKHQGQRYGDRPYTHHLTAVRQVLIDHNINGDVCVAAWLHDVQEDCATTNEEIASLFGTDVARLVECVTGDGTERAQQVESAYRKIVASCVVGLSRDALWLKLADRIANAEASRATGGHHLRRYRTEQQGFERMVYMACGTNMDPTTAAMLARLRSALANRVDGEVCSQIPCPLRHVHDDDRPAE